MNERIKELMEQAGLYDFVIESMGIAEEMQKAAELIVRECAEVSNQAEKQCQHPGTMIKQHFGVDQ